MIITKINQWLIKLKNIHFLLIDTIVFLITPVLALELRLDKIFVIQLYGIELLIVILLFLVVKLSVLYKFGFYKRYWRYASIDELIETIILIASAVVLQTLLFYLLYYSSYSLLKNLPRSLPFLDGILSLLLIGGLRFSVRAIERINQRFNKLCQGDRLLIVGAGSAGLSLVEEMQRHPQLGFYPIAFIDDDPAKFKLRIRGLNVVGNRYDIPKVVHYWKINKVIIAMPTVGGEVIREILDICQSIKVQTSTLPGIHEILNGRVSLNSIRDIKIEDLLRREPIQTEIENVLAFLKGKKVLITGAGGSIGSELCRQIVKCHPAEMMLLGHGENSVFNIHQELERVVKLLKQEGEDQENKVRLTTFIADIRFPSRLKYTFDQFRPDIIFHAAAHKHVPLMELNAPEAITNNVLGTKNLLDLALQYDVKHFVMISTDKAVNPTSIMGTSKRVAEMLVLRAAQKSKKPFVVVRFGNVLGSRGSVVPIFKQQIAQGGPVTITHPEIQRYFMTIPEAVQLVLQASVIGQGGEVFMLDMGEPVKIVDLAKDMIRLSGYEVGKDINIVFTGLRPGEKLFEELTILGEQYEQTQHQKIMTVRNASGIVPENFEPIVATIQEAANKNDSNLIVCLLKQLVPEYTPNNLKVNLKTEIRQENTHLNNGSESKQSSNQAAYTAEHTYNSLLPIGNNLRQALEYQPFQIHYQPIFSLQTNRITGFEALLRHWHPKQGLVSPAKFMPVIEQTGLIIPVGWWVFHQVCYQSRVWQEEFSANLPLVISINLSIKEFFQPDLVKQIKQILRETGLDTNSLKLEITEAVVMENFDAANNQLLQLKELGVQLQIDQLGIGYAFISRLQILPNFMYYEKFDSLNMDRSLVAQIDIDEKSLEIVEIITAIAHDLGMDVNATGVETVKQLNQLKTLKCKHGQGYLFSKPVKAEAAKKLLTAQLQQLA